MNIARYENELRQGMTEAVGKLNQIHGFVLHAFNIWTDPQVGVSEFSADTKRNSDNYVREMREWQFTEVQKLRAEGRDKLADLVARPFIRSDNPADFEHRGIVRIKHADWDLEMTGDGGWDVVEEVLTRLRDEAAVLIGQRLSVEPDAEVSIGTRTDWRDRPVPVTSARSAATACEAIRRPRDG